MNEKVNNVTITDYLRVNELYIKLPGKRKRYPIISNINETGQFVQKK